MSLFYDPKKKEPQAWVLPFFIVIALLFVIVAFIIMKNMSDKTIKEEATQQEDIFK